MDHDISGIEYIIPIGNMLYVDKVDNATVYESIQYIAGSTPDYEAEANILIALDWGAEPEIDAHAD